jgi:hypothetical protein
MNAKLICQTVGVALKDSYFVFRKIFFSHLLDTVMDIICYEKRNI